MTLTFDVLTPKSIGVFYSIRALKFEGSGSKGTRVIERKRSVTDGQTDRQTDSQTARQPDSQTDRRTDGQGKNNMSPPEGGET